jgi:hypothetical protein
LVKQSGWLLDYLSPSRAHGADDEPADEAAFDDDDETMCARNFIDG